MTARNRTGINFQPHIRASITHKTKIEEKEVRKRHYIRHIRCDRSPCNQISEFVFVVYHLNLVTLCCFMCFMCLYVYDDVYPLISYANVG